MCKAWLSSGGFKVCFKYFFPANDNKVAVVCTFMLTAAAHDKMTRAIKMSCVVFDENVFTLTKY